MPERRLILLHGRAESIHAFVETHASRRPQALYLQLLRNFPRSGFELANMEAGDESHRSHRTSFAACTNTERGAVIGGAVTGNPHGAAVGYRGWLLLSGTK
jgi:hypothetical protein